jgi:hypothetical protein
MSGKMEPAFHAGGQTSLFEWFQAVNLFVHFCTVKDTIAILVDDSDFDSLSVEFCVVGTPERFKTEFHSGIEGQAFFPMGFEVLKHRVSSAANGTSMVGLVGAAWVGFVEVDAVVVNAANQECGTEWT